MKVIIFKNRKNELFYDPKCETYNWFFDLVVAHINAETKYRVILRKNNIISFQILKKG